MIKRFIALLAAVMLAVTALPALAEGSYTIEYVDGWTPEIISGYYTSDSDIARLMKYTAVYDSIGAQ